MQAALQQSGQFAEMLGDTRSAQASQRPRYQVELDWLGSQVEEFFREQNIFLAVRCAFQQGRLLVVGNHRAGEEVEPKRVMRSLEHLMQSFQLTMTQPVGLYLRVAGQPKPYVRCQFMVRSPHQPPAAAVGQATGLTGQELALTADAPNWLVGETLVLEPQAPALERSTLPSSLVETWTSIRRASQQIQLGKSRETLSWVAGVGAAGLAVGGYALSQPCVTGTCSELNTAQLLGQRSAALLDVAATQSDLHAAQQYLDGAIGMLDTIPMWSNRRAEAQNLAHDYRRQAIALTEITTAASFAQQAFQQSQHSLQDAETWQAVEALWKHAIQQLEQVPANSDYYPLAQQSLKESHASLARVQERIQQEQQGQQALALAKQMMRLATEKQASTAAAKDPHLAQVMWQVAIDRLGDVPANTTSIFEAKRLLNVYEDRVIAATSAVQKPAIPALLDASAVGSDAVTNSGEGTNRTSIDQTIQALPPPPTVVAGQ